MAKAEEASGNIRISSPSRLAILFRAIIILAVLLGILLIAGAVIVGGTEGGRAFVEDWLEKRMGMPLTVGKTRIAFPYVLEAEDVVSEARDPNDKPLFEAKSLRFAFGVSPFMRVEVDRAKLILVEKETGSWEPAVFSRLSYVLERNVSAVSQLTKDFREKMVISISDSSIYWSAQDAIPASIGHLSFELSWARVADKRMYYHFLSVDNMVDIRGPKVSEAEREWLATDENPYIEIGRLDRVESSRQSFWYVPPVSERVPLEDEALPRETQEPQPAGGSDD